MEYVGKSPAVYMMANRYRGTLYVGVTSALYGRVSNHKNKTFDGFTAAYGLDRLVWYAHFPSMEDAIHREKTAEEMEARMEVSFDRNGEPELV